MWIRSGWHRFYQPEVYSLSDKVACPCLAGKTIVTLYHSDSKPLAESCRLNSCCSRMVAGSQFGPGSQQRLE
jgi:hypothetical protein